MIKLIQDHEYIDGFEKWMKSLLINRESFDMVLIAACNAAWCQGRRELAERIGKMFEDEIAAQEVKTNVEKREEEPVTISEETPQEPDVKQDPDLPDFQTTL